MTLLAGELNIGASNNPFSRKKGSYKKSNISITQALSEYPYFKFSQIDQRGEDFAEVAAKIWSM